VYIYKYVYIYNYIYIYIYIGYISLWTRMGENIRINNLQNDENNENNAKLGNKFKPVIICMGGEWYTFPSHFFLPNNARIEYVYDNFHGELPQHFNSILGTYIFICIYVSVYEYIYMYIYIFIYTSIYIYLNTHIIYIPFIINFRYQFYTITVI
jgi:hypothetical protein